MAVIRCPHCNKPNPDFLQVCQYCDKPLNVAAASPSPAEEPAPEQPAAGLPDWLQTNTGPLDTSALTGAGAEMGEVPDWLKGTLGAAPAAAGAPPLGEPELPAAAVPDWLKSMTSPLPTEPQTPAAPAGEVPDWLKSATSPLPAQGDVPDWLKETVSAPAGEAELPDWLKSLGATSSLAAEPPAPVQPAPPAPAEEPAAAPDWMTGQTGSLPPAEDAVPNWLKSLSGATMNTGALEPQAVETSLPPLPAAPEAEAPDWLKESASPAAPEAEVPDWLREATGPLPELPATPPKATAPFTAPLEEADVPDWLQQATGPLSSTPSTTGGTAPFSTPIEAEPEWAQAATPAADETPDWLKSLGAEMAPAESAAPSAGFAPAEPASVEPDWMRDIGQPTPPATPPATPSEPAAGAGAEPDWLASLRQDASVGAAATAASLLPATAPFGVPPAPEEQPAAAPTPSGAEPDWLAALRAAPPSEPESPTGAPLELAQGELPSWLSAMRPVDVQPSAVEREVDEYQETVGVLTGMKGVLRAEPSVVLPGRSATQVHALNVSPAQQTQAEMLAAMLAEDRAETPAAKRAARRLPWERWAVALVLLLGVLVPPLMYKFEQGLLFPLPRSSPAEVQVTHDFLNGVPTEKPVLVAFDYEPAQSGELRPVAEAVLSHLMRRGVRFAAVSTSLAGAGEGGAVLDRLANDPFIRGNAPNTYRYGETHLNLGYLPGGPVGILQFALSPQMVIRTDFQGNDFAATQGLWAQAPVAGVSSLDDFGAVIVLSAAPDDARAWVEQTQTRRAPLVLIVSGGAGPMVRPYYEADPNRIRGFMAGPMTALQYNVWAKANVSDAAYDEALLRWQMLGGGLLTSALLIMLGALAYGLALAVRRGRVRA
jgi:hypothetical protein